MKWCYEENGQIVGPVSEEEVAERFHAGVITLQTRVRPDGAGAWEPLAQWPAFTHLWRKPRADTGMNERKVLIALIGSIGTVIGIGLADRITFWDAVICGVVTFCLIITVMALSSMKRDNK
jgi:hypothetical protein